MASLVLPALEQRTGLMCPHCHSMLQAELLVLEFTGQHRAAYTHRTCGGVVAIPRHREQLAGQLREGRPQTSKKSRDGKLRKDGRPGAGRRVKEVVKNRHRHDREEVFDNGEQVLNDNLEESVTTGAIAAPMASFPGAPHTKGRARTASIPKGNTMTTKKSGSKTGHKMGQAGKPIGGRKLDHDQTGAHGTTTKDHGEPFGRKQKNTGGQWERLEGNQRDGDMAESTGHLTPAQIATTLTDDGHTAQSIFDGYARGINYVSLREFNEIARAYGCACHDESLLLKLMESNHEYMFIEGQDAQGRYWVPQLIEGNSRSKKDCKHEDTVVRGDKRLCAWCGADVTGKWQGENVASRPAITEGNSSYVREQAERALKYLRNGRANLAADAIGRAMDNCESGDYACEQLNKALQYLRNGRANLAADAISRAMDQMGSADSDDMDQMDQMEGAVARPTISEGGQTIKTGGVRDCSQGAKDLKMFVRHIEFGEYREASEALERALEHTDPDGYAHSQIEKALINLYNHRHDIAVACAARARDHMESIDKHTVSLSEDVATEMGTLVEQVTGRPQGKRLRNGRRLPLNETKANKPGAGRRGRAVAENFQEYTPDELEDRFSDPGYLDATDHSTFPYYGTQEDAEEETYGDDLVGGNYGDDQERAGGWEGSAMRSSDAASSGDAGIDCPECGGPMDELGCPECGYVDDEPVGGIPDPNFGPDEVAQGREFAGAMKSTGGPFSRQARHSHDHIDDFMDAEAGDMNAAGYDADFAEGRRRPGRRLSEDGHKMGSPKGRSIAGSVHHDSGLPEEDTEMSDMGREWPRRQKNTGSAQEEFGQSKHGDPCDGIQDHEGEVWGRKQKNTGGQWEQFEGGQHSGKMTGGAKKMYEGVNLLAQHVRRLLAEYARSSRLVAEQGRFPMRFMVSAGEFVKPKLHNQLTEALADAEELVQVFGPEAVSFEAQFCRPDGSIALKRLVPLINVPQRGLVVHEGVAGGRLLFRFPEVARDYADLVVREGKACRAVTHNWGAAVSAQITLADANKLFRTLKEEQRAPIPASRRR